MTEPTKAQLLTALASQAKRHRNREDAADEALANRDAAMLYAADAGATYPELAEATGLTRHRVNQVLREQRALRAQATAD